MAQSGPAASSDQALPADPAPSSRRLGVGTALVLALGGVVLGLFGGFLQAWTVPVAGWSAPVGLVLVLATLIAAERALVHAFGIRRAAVAFFLGWAVISVLLALPTPDGDIVIGAETLGVVYLFGGVVLGSAAANLPPRLRPGPADA